MTRGVILLIAGVVGLVTVYSMRPPSGLGDAFMMMGQGRQTYLKEPVYFGLMAISGIIAILGIVSIVKDKDKEKE